MLLDHNSMPSQLLHVIAKVNSEHACILKSTSLSSCILSLFLPYLSFLVYHPNHSGIMASASASLLLLKCQLSLGPILFSSLESLGWPLNLEMEI